MHGRASNRIRTIIADDSEMIRNTIAEVVSTHRDLEVVGTAGDGCEAIAMAKKHRPGLVLMDVQMPCLDGLAATLKLIRELPSTHVILMSVHDYPSLRSMCRKSGALGFIPKERVQDELPHYIKKIENFSHHERYGT